MGYFQEGVPEQIMTGILKTVPINSFVETGTFFGYTAIWASSHFKNVYTIEIAEELYHTASGREDAKGKNNIHFIHGNSLEVLPRIVREVEHNTLFWLDSHYSGFGTGGVDNECPVLEEIKIISICKEATILIDDARCFLGPPPPPSNPAHWPGIAEIFASIKYYFPSHYTTIVDDVIISVPQNLKAVLDADWLANINKRYPGPSFFKKMAALIRRIIKKTKSIILNKPNF